MLSNIQQFFLAASIVALAWLGLRYQENKARRERHARSIRSRLGLSETGVE
jgi:hypothetical protein